MTNQADISIREVQQDLGIICSFVKSSDPDRTTQAAPNLVALIERFRDSAATRTNSGAVIYDLMIRARENLRIGCFNDAFDFLTEARELAAIGWPVAGETTTGEK
jgi:hypothetical protein